MIFRLVTKGFVQPRATGADVPVCLDAKARVMRGIGEILSDPIALPRLSAVLVNPGVALPTRDVFAALAAPGTGVTGSVRRFWRYRHGCGIARRILTARRNDLEIPAIKIQTIIADVLEALRGSPNCRLARMSGSGATCFGLFGSAGAAEEASRQMQAACPGWWVRAATLG